MPTIAAVGQSFAMDGREACLQAIEQARQKILHEANNVVLALIFASRDYPWQGILNGASAQLRDTPLFGFSTNGQLSSTGEYQRSVVVALLAGSDIDVKANWWPEFTQNSPGIIGELVENLGVGMNPDTTLPPILFICADGIQNHDEQFEKLLPKNVSTVGCLTGSSLRQLNAFQIGGASGGERGLAAALLQGNLKIGVGAGHGWQPIGKYFQITRAEGPWIRMLDNQPSAEAYATLFGGKARDWAFPPLNELVRLYPLGVESKVGNPLVIRSPLQVEVDGSFRMNSPIKDGNTAHLLIGSQATCLKAASDAAERALENLGAARPILALVFADIAWKMIFETQPGHELSPIREILGPNLPIAGGYSIAQICPVPGGVEIMNQHIEVILLGAVD